MSLAIVYSRARVGMDAPLVTVEVHLSNGLPCLSIVGLPETAVKESKDRVRGAILNSNFEFPARRITINLAPADLPKEGGRFDLPIALGILAASRQIPDKELHHYEFAGELALSGELRAVHGILPMSLQTHAVQRTLVIPAGNTAEATLINNARVLAGQQLLAITAHLTHSKRLDYAAPVTDTPPKNQAPDLTDVRGQQHARRALEIAAAKRRAFRAPHHTASAVAMVGGGSNPCPGEISLAHHGVLFLDELAEFDRRVLEVLREPLESGRIMISRAARHAEFPARFQLVAAMNPCPCGYLGDMSGRCRCNIDQVERYRRKISGPLLDRIDMYIEVPRLSFTELEGPQGESSATVRERVTNARDVQTKRNNTLNSQLTHQQIEDMCKLTKTDRLLLQQAVEKLQLSARSYHRILKLARTIADMDVSPAINTAHLTEAINYRKLDRTF
jgi:magnesium chelatase family protein